MTLGKTIGKVEHTFKTTNVNDEETSIKLSFDFTNASDSDIKSWLVSNRVIAMQRPLRVLSAIEIKALEGNTIDVNTCGQKMRSKAEQFKLGLKALRAAGLNDEADKLEKAYNEKKQN